MILAEQYSYVERYSRLVKLPHAVFALPFALAMLVIAGRTHSVSVWQCIWIVVAVLTARSAAMTYNRIVDRDIDALNPRTKEREIPRGTLSVHQAKIFLWINSIGFVCSSAALGRHCLVLSPLVLMVLFFYSWTKRFTPYSHAALGLALALAPGGVWYAVTAEWSLSPVILMVAVLLWVSGFDILYSCQDVKFDRDQALFSVPVWLGLETSFALARLLHVLSVVHLWWFGVHMGCGVIYFLSVLVFGVFLVRQHLLVRPDDFTRIDAAFFASNGLASVLFFLGVLIDGGVRL